MNFFNYTQDGKTKVGYYHSNWNEVPFKAFIEWQHLAKQLGELNEQLKGVLDSLVQKQKDIQGYIDKGQSNVAAKMQSALVVQAEKIKAIKDHVRPLELKAIALFTDCPLSYIMQLKGFDADKIGFEPNADWIDAPIDSIQFFKSLFWALSKSPLPTDKPLSKMQWQTKTDAEIAQLQKSYDSLTWVKKHFTAYGKDLKKRFDKAISSDWQIVDIWEHSTYANSQFQKTAKVIVNEMERGIWDNLDTLICMCMVECDVHGSIEKELKNEGNPNAYLEKYALRYKQLFDRNKELFFGQKQTLSVGHLLGIRGFFLLKSQK